jgi:hypothetical protein
VIGKKMLSRAAWVLVIFLGACATKPPQAEFSTYLAAFEEARAATGEILRTYAPIERAVRRPRPQESEDDTDLPFDPDDASYWSALGRPGVSAQIDRGFSVVERYNAVLTSYVAGDSVEQLRPALSTLGTEVGLLGSVVGLPAVGAAFGPIVDAFQTFAGALLAVSDRAEFARVVEANTGIVRDFLSTLREITPEMYASARQQANARRIDFLRADREADAAAVTQDLKLFRQMLADWVLLLERTDRSIDALQSAVVSGQTSRLTAVDLAFWTSELRRHAEEVKFAARAIRSIAP